MLAHPASVNYFQKLGFIHSLGSTTRRWFYFGTLYLCSDETQFRNCIVWLEDQKIRHYKIEDRGNLRNIPSSDWPKAYQKVRKAPRITLHAHQCAQKTCFGAVPSLLNTGFLCVVPAGCQLPVRSPGEAGGFGLAAGPGC